MRISIHEPTILIFLHFCLEILCFKINITNVVFFAGDLLCSCPKLCEFCVLFNDLHETQHILIYCSYLVASAYPTWFLRSVFDGTLNAKKIGEAHVYKYDIGFFLCRGVPAGNGATLPAFVRG